MRDSLLHRDCLVLDGHTDVPTRLFHTPADLTRRGPGHVDLPRLREGGVDALVFALYVPAALTPEAGWRHAMELWHLTRAQLRPGGLEVAVSAEQVRRTVAQGGVAVVLGLENGRPLVLPEALARFADLGVRYVTPTHVASHEWCDASTDDPIHGGLAETGIDLVREMNRRGILVDVSHVSDAAVLQILAVSRTPVVASHSSARALCDYPRNLPDDLVREIARRGGVVMANSYPAFLDDAACEANRERLAGLRAHLGEAEAEAPRSEEERARMRREFLAAHPLPRVPLERFVDHVIHLVELAGEEHVGIGTDFDGIPDTLEGFGDVAEFPSLTAALLDRGVDRAGVRQILGESFLRLLEEAERRAE